MLNGPSDQPAPVIEAEDKATHGYIIKFLILISPDGVAYTLVEQTSPQPENFLPVLRSTTNSIQ